MRFQRSNRQGHFAGQQLRECQRFDVRLKAVWQAIAPRRHKTVTCPASRQRTFMTKYARTGNVITTKISHSLNIYIRSDGDMIMGSITVQYNCFARFGCHLLSPRDPEVVPVRYRRLYGGPDTRPYHGSCGFEDLPEDNSVEAIRCGLCSQTNGHNITQWPSRDDHWRDSSFARREPTIRGCTLR